MTPPDPQEHDELLDLGLTTAFRPALTPRIPGERAEPMLVETVPPPDQPPASIGRYVTRGVVARGGMGIIVRAHDPELLRDVAIKLLHGRAATDQELQQLFREEARVMGQLQHPGIVPVHDQGRLPDGRPFYVMHLIAGESLRSLVRSADRSRLLDVFARVCDTIVYAHSRGVVHGDLKPANVMVGAFGEVQVLDWGFARSVQPGPGDSRARILGTPAYMAPELARGDRAALDVRVDVFGLGSILCEILTGAPPYQGRNRDEVFLRASQGWLDDAFTRLEGCGADPELMSLTRRCLARDPAERPADAAQVAQQLGRYLAALAQRAQDLAMAAAKADARADAEARARRRTLGAAILVVAALGLGTALLVWQLVREAGLRATAERRAGAALARAAVLRDRAREAGDDPRRAWTEATAVAREAEQTAEAAEVPEALRVEARALRRETEALASAAARDAQLRRLIDEVRPHLGDQAASGDIEGGYRELLQCLDVDADQGDLAASAAVLRASPQSVPLARALHEWAHLRYRREAAAGADRLLQLADAADPDPWRTELRRLCHRRDAAALRSLAAPGAGSTAGHNLGLLAQCLVHAGDRETAVRVFRTAHLHDPGDYWICHELAELLWSLPDRNKAEVTQLFSVAAALRPDSVHARVDLAQALFEQGEVEAARVVAEQAQALDPGYRRLWACWCGIREALGDRNGAVAAAKELVRLAPRRADGYVLLTGALQRADRNDEVLEVAWQAVVALPESGMTQRLLGLELLAQGCLGQAVAAMRRATELEPATVESWYDFGVVLADSGMDAEAAGAYQKALALRPDHPESLCNLSGSLARLGQLALALAVVRRGAELGARQPGWSHPTAEWIRAIEEQIELERRLPQDAAELDDQVTAVDRVRMGELALHKGRTSLAFALLSDGLAHDPGLDGRYWDLALRAAARLAGDAQEEPSQRVRAARQAQAWLRRAARGVQTAIEDGSVPPRVPRGVLEHWLISPDFAALRDRSPAASSPAPWPAADADSWSALWQGIRDLRSGLELTPPAIPKK